MNILRIIWVEGLIVAAYGIGMFMFISAVWYKWYPALQDKLNSVITTWVIKVGLNGLAGFLGYLYAHDYLNTLTGVDPNNFPKTLLAFTVPYAGYIWLVFIALGVGLVVLGCMLWMLGIVVWNGLVGLGELPFLVGLLLVQWCKFLCCVVDQFFKTIPNYAKCREHFLATVSDSKLPEKHRPQWFQEKDITIRTFLTYLFGPIAILACVAFLEQLPKHPPLDRWIHRAATSVLVFADFARDKTCSASSATRWVASIKDRKEQDAPKVLVADLSTWPDIQFSMGACK